MPADKADILGDGHSLAGLVFYDTFVGWTPYFTIMRNMGTLPKDLYDIFGFMFIILQS